MKLSADSSVSSGPNHSQLVWLPFVGALDGKFVIGRDKLELGRSLTDALESLPHGGHGCICTKLFGFCFFVFLYIFTLENVR